MQYTLTELERNAYMAGNPLGDDLIGYAVVGQALLDDGDDLFGDIKSGFPDEDCLSAQIRFLSDIIAGMRRSDNRTLLEQLLAEMSEKQHELAQAAEYGRDELRKAIERLDGACS